MFSILSSIPLASATPTPTPIPVVVVAGAGDTSLMPQIAGILHNPLILSLLILPLALIFLDVLTGVLSAIKRKVFLGKHITDFLGNDLLRYIASFFLVLLAWLTFGTYSATTLTTTLGMGSLSVSIIASILENLQEIFGASSSDTPEMRGALSVLTQLAQTNPASVPPGAPLLMSSTSGVSSMPSGVVTNKQRYEQILNQNTAPLPAIALQRKQMDAPTLTMPTPFIPGPRMMQMPITLPGKAGFEA